MASMNFKSVVAEVAETATDSRAAVGGGQGSTPVHSQVVKIKEEDEDLLRLSPRERLMIFNFSSQMKQVFLAGNSGRPAFRSPLGINTAEQAPGPCGIQATR